MMIDFHTHILPGIDDGSDSVKESLAMLRMEAQQGVSQVVATPHFYARYDSPERFLENRSEAFTLLSQAMQQEPDLPRITLGAEVYFFRGMSESEILQQLTIGGSNHILVELPMGTWGDEVFRELDAIYDKQGLVPVIAHLDRYIGPFRTRSILKRLEPMPVMVQANANFFLERRTERLAMQLLKTDRIQLLGSDCHNLTDRPPNLNSAVQQIRNRIGAEPLMRIRGYEQEILGMESPE